MGLSGIVRLVNRFLDLGRWVYRTIKRKRQQRAYNRLKKNPARWYNNHFSGGVRDEDSEPTKQAGKADDRNE